MSWTPPARRQSAKARRVAAAAPAAAGLGNFLGVQTMKTQTLLIGAALVVGAIVLLNMFGGASASGTDTATGSLGGGTADGSWLAGATVAGNSAPKTGA